MRDRKYEIRAPSKEVCALWKQELGKRLSPPRLFARLPPVQEFFEAWISSPATAGQLLPEAEYRKIEEWTIWGNYSHDYEDFGREDPARGTVYYRDSAGCVWDSKGKYYPCEYFAIFGVMPPLGMDHDAQMRFTNRPYPKPEFEHEELKSTPSVALLNYTQIWQDSIPDSLYRKDLDAWFKICQWPRDHVRRRELKLQRGIPLDGDDNTPPPTPIGRGGDDDDYDAGGYDEPVYEDDIPPISYDDDEQTASTSTSSHDPEEARRKALERRVAQWEGQCKQIEEVNARARETHKRAMDDYKRKHKEWVDSTKEKCFSCSGKGGRDCTECRGAGSKQGKKCMSCSGKGHFDCLKCNGHKGLAHGPKGKGSEPKEPRDPPLKSLPSRPK